MARLYADMQPEEKQDALAALMEMGPKAYAMIAAGDAADLVASSPAWEDRFLAATSPQTPEGFLLHMANVDRSFPVRAQAAETLGETMARRQGLKGAMASFTVYSQQADPDFRSGELERAADELAGQHRLARPFLMQYRTNVAPAKYPYIMDMLTAAEMPSRLAYTYATDDDCRRELVAALGKDPKTMKERAEDLGIVLRAAVERAGFDKFVRAQADKGISKFEAAAEKGIKEAARRERRARRASGRAKRAPGEQKAEAIDRADVEALRAKMPELLAARFGIENLNKNFRCPSPAHDDADPSAHYYEASSTVHCFGCGKSWDAFQLIGELEGHDRFPDQARALAEAVGYTLASGAPANAGEKARSEVAVPEPKGTQAPGRSVARDASAPKRQSMAARLHPGAKVNVHRF